MEGRLEDEEEWINHLEGRLMHSRQAEQQKVKRIKRNENR